MEPESWVERLGFSGFPEENSEIPWDAKACMMEEAGFLKALQKLSGDRPLAISAPSHGGDPCLAIDSNMPVEDWPVSPSNWEWNEISGFDNNLDSGFSAESELSDSSDVKVP